MCVCIKYAILVLTVVIPRTNIMTYMHEKVKYNFSKESKYFYFTKNGICNLLSILLSFIQVF